METQAEGIGRQIVGEILKRESFRQVYIFMHSTHVIRDTTVSNEWYMLNTWNKVHASLVLDRFGFSLQGPEDSLWTDVNSNEYRE